MFGNKKKNGIREIDANASAQSKLDLKMRKIEQYAVASMQGFRAANLKNDNGSYLRSSKGVANYALEDAKALYDALEQFEKSEQEKIEENG